MKTLLKTFQPLRFVNKTNKTKSPPEPTLKKYLSKAERVNGRAAMIGFVSAVVTESMTGANLTTQLMENLPLTVVASSLVTLGTASNPKDEGVIWSFFTPDAELVNGRMAMLGMLLLLSLNM